MDKILELANKIKDCYGVNGAIYVHDTIDKLCEKGIAKSCFVDYGVLADIIGVLDEFEKLVTIKLDK